MNMQLKFTRTNFETGRGNSPVLDRLVTSTENPSDYCSVCKSLLFNVLQRTSPYISPHGRTVPLSLIQQTSPWTGGTATWGGTEDSVRCQARANQQQSGG